MEIRLSPDQEARLAAVAARTGRSTGELVQEAIALWEERQVQPAKPRHTPGEAAARIRELSKGVRLPDGVTIKDLISTGRA